MKNTLILSFNLLTLTFLTFSPLAAQTAKPTSPTVPQLTNPNATFADYKKECLARVKQNRTLAEFAEELCTCTIDTYKKKYSIQAFRALVKKAQPNAQGKRSPEAEAAMKTLMAVGEDCASDIVFE
jgi:hypothetical protein